MNILAAMARCAHVEFESGTCLTFDSDAERRVWESGAMLARKRCSFSSSTSFCRGHEFSYGLNLNLRILKAAVGLGAAATDPLLNGERKTLKAIK